MNYSEFVEVYERLAATPKHLEKTSILASFFKKLKDHGEKEWAYLLFGRVLPDYDPGELGISRQLAIKAIAASYAVRDDEVVKRFSKVGDLGEIAEYFADKKKQSVLFSGKLSVKKVFDNILKIVHISGKGAVDKKIELISELLSRADGKEARYIVRTLLSDLRVGVADGILRDALVEAFFPNDRQEMTEKIEEVYDLVNDFALVFEAASKGKKEIEKMEITPGRPIKVMLAVKAESIEDAFRICGKPAAIEHKYDGFRMLINKNGDNVSLFTRKLENVTSQFPDVIKVIKEDVSGDSFILDSEIVGFDPKTKKYTPFQSISQRIRRKYDVDKLIKELPVEINVFDVVYYNGKSLIEKTFIERRKLVEKIVRHKEMKIRIAEQIITDSEEEAMKFYKKALELGEEGIMIKKLDAPYKQGRRVGYMAKLKPIVNDLDLVIVGAESGSGKRGGLLTSYIIACRSGEHFLEVGKVSSGLKEKEEEGLTYNEMTKMLKPLIVSTEGNNVKVKPKIVVSVNYQDIQKSPSYSSGFALRFPRITAYRPDRTTGDITTLVEIKKESERVHINRMG